MPRTSANQSSSPISRSSSRARAPRSSRGATGHRVRPAAVATGVHATTRGVRRCCQANAHAGRVSTTAASSRGRSAGRSRYTSMTWTTSARNQRGGRSRPRQRPARAIIARASHRPASSAVAIPSATSDLWCAVITDADCLMSPAELTEAAIPWCARPWLHDVKVWACDAMPCVWCRPRGWPRSDRANPTDLPPTVRTATRPHDSRIR